MVVVHPSPPVVQLLSHPVSGQAHKGLCWPCRRCLYGHGRRCPCGHCRTCSYGHCRRCPYGHCRTCPYGHYIKCPSLSSAWVPSRLQFLRCGIFINVVGNFVPQYSFTQTDGHPFPSPVPLSLHASGPALFNAAITARLCHTCCGIAVPAHSCSVIALFINVLLVMLSL
jgi:hypothetical protein